MLLTDGAGACPLGGEGEGGRVLDQTTTGHTKVLLTSISNQLFTYLCLLAESCLAAFRKCKTAMHFVRGENSGEPSYYPAFDPANFRTVTERHGTAIKRVSDSYCPH